MCFFLFFVNNSKLDMIKIYLADDHTLIREGIKNLTLKEKDIVVIGETSNPAVIVEQVKNLNPDILILDISMPGKSGLDVLKELKLIAPGIKVLIMTIIPEEQLAKRTLKAGALGYITKDSDPEELLKAIRKVASGKKYISNSLTQRLIDDLSESSKKEPYELLSDREFQVLKMMAHGKTQTEIAEELSLGITTVNTYRSRLLEKLNLNSNAELIHFAYRNNLID